MGYNPFGADLMFAVIAAGSVGTDIRREVNITVIQIDRAVISAQRAGAGILPHIIPSLITALRNAVMRDPYGPARKNGIVEHFFRKVFIAVNAGVITGGGDLCTEGVNNL